MELEAGTVHYLPNALSSPPSLPRRAGGGSLRPRRMAGLLPLAPARPCCCCKPAVALRLAWAALLTAALIEVAITNAALPDNSTAAAADWPATTLPSTTPAADSCPAWLAEYAAWQRKARLLQSSKFLVWTCMYGQKQSCGGLGDRLRGIMWALRVAVASGRVLMLHQDSPAAMGAFWTPGSIDWRLSEALLSPNAGGGRSRRLRCTATSSAQEGRTKDLRDLQAGALMKEWKDDRIVAVASDMPTHYGAGPGAPVVKWLSHDMHCMFNALFKPAKAVQEVRRCIRTLRGGRGEGRRARRQGQGGREGGGESGEGPGLHRRCVCGGGRGSSSSVPRVCAVVALNAASPDEQAWRPQQGNHGPRHGCVCRRVATGCLTGRASDVSEGAKLPWLACKRT